MPIDRLTQIAGTRMINSFTQAVEQKRDKARIVFNGNQQLGPVKAFFSSKIERNTTIDMFQRGLIAKYGEQLGSMATARLDHLKAHGRPLRAGMVRDILSDIERTKADLPRANALLTARYISDVAQAHADACVLAEQKGVPSHLRDTFESVVKTIVQEQGMRADTKVMTESALKEVMKDAAAKWETMYNGAARGDLVPAFRDVMSRVPADCVVDITVIATLYTGRRSGQLGLSAILENLSAMRARQPEGILTVDTIWSVCTNAAPMPAGCGTPASNLGEHLENFFFDKSAILDATRPGAGMDANLCICSGMKRESAEALAQNHGAVGMDDIFSAPALYTLNGTETLATAELLLAADLCRMGKEDGGVHSFFSFSQAGHEPVVIDANNPLVAGAQNSDAYNNAQPSEVTSIIRQNVESLCGTNHKQALIVLYGLAQAGLATVRNFSLLTGATKSEHCAMNINVSREANGTIRMDYTRPAGHGLIGGYSYIVQPDGTSRMSALDLRAEPA